MPKQTVSTPIWGHLAKHTDLKPKYWNYGTTHDKDKVMFMGMYHRSDTGEFPPYGTEYEIKLDSGVRTTFNGLGDDTCPTVFFTQEKKFDDYCVESGIFKKIGELKKEIDNIEERIIDSLIACLSGDDSYDPDDDTRLQEDLESEKKQLVREYEKLYQRYDQFIGSTHAEAFKRVVDAKVGVSREVSYEIWDYTSKAYELEDPAADGSRAFKFDKPLPQFDGKDPPTGADYGLHYVKVKTPINQPELTERDDETFQRCRIHYRLFDICAGFYGVADATRAYLTNNLRLPHLRMGVPVKDLLITVKGISKHLELLPCRKDHPDCVNDSRVARTNVPLNAVEMCDILKRAMHPKVLEHFEKDNKDKNLFDDPDEMARDLDQIIDLLPPEFKADDRKESQKKKESKKAKKKDGSKSSSEASQRCNRCDKMKEKEIVITSHPTKECSRWRYCDKQKKLVPKNDSEKKTYTPRDKSKQVHNHNRDDDYRTPRSSRRGEGSSSRKRYRDSGSGRRGRSRSRSSSRSRSYSSDSRSRSSSRSRSPSYDDRDRRSRGRRRRHHRRR